MRNIGPEFDLLGLRLNAHCRETRGDNLRRIQYLFVEFWLAGPDFGDIEHVGNEFEEMLPAVEDGTAIFSVDRGSESSRFLVPDWLRKPQDRGERLPALLSQYGAESGV